MFAQMGVSVKYLVVVFIVLSSSCHRITSTEEQSRNLIKQAEHSIGAPHIVNFTEKRFAKLIYEMRDREITTYSYFMAMDGRLHFLCKSIGYGIPYSVQYVNPMANTHHQYALPQAEPNALFMPDSLDATFVICVDEKGKPRPVYSEPKLIVSPFQLKASGSLQKEEKP